jgi:hypothetical protein
MLVDHDLICFAMLTTSLGIMIDVPSGAMTMAVSW